MSIGKWGAGAAVRMCAAASERLGACEEYCLGVAGVIERACVLRWEDGKSRRSASISPTSSIIQVCSGP